MRTRQPVRVDDDGRLVIPEEFRRRHGLEADARVIVEWREDGLFLRPVSSVCRHTYSEQRRAEFLLANATDDEEYRRVAEKVRTMGLDPNDIPYGRIKKVC